MAESLKRSPSSDEYEKTPSPTKKTKTTPKSPAKSSGSSSSPKTFTNPKAIYAQMIFEAGLKALNKTEVKAATGLTPSAQQDLVRKDKGSLGKGFNGFCASL